MRASASKKTLFATEQDRPDVARRRRRWQAYQDRLDPARLIFIDETWAKTNMTRLRGWAPRGRKLLAKVPQGHWRTLTFLAALRHDRIDAPCVIDGPDQWRELPGLCRADAGADAQTRRHRHHRQSRQPQEQSGAPRLFAPPAPGCSSCRPTAPISIRSSRSSPSSRPCSARPPSAPSKPPGDASALCSALHPAGMRQLLQKRRICFNLNGSDSRRRKKRTRKSESVVADAVYVEHVSATEFPANREINRENRENGP